MMPRITLPPTPASSTDMKGKDGTQQLTSLQLAFELPPPALTPFDASQISPSDSTVSKSQSKYPMQPSEVVKSRRRASTTRETAREPFALPPPPTRSRKIIQMKPREEREPAESSAKATSAASGKAAPTTAASPTATNSVGSSKKKQPSTTSAAGRKIARKTAHSLIERRRRSKMNEEFAVLKDMIPACTGEMHKLAILQASIEYVRYLEDCVAQLKAQQEAQSDRSEVQTPAGLEAHGSVSHAHHYGDNSGDVEMGASGAESSPYVHALGSHQSSISPAIPAEDIRHRQDSNSSISTDRRHYSFSASATTSPAFGPQQYGYGGHLSASASTLTSPALHPQRDLDQEATAALLMLNSDRRGMPFKGGNGRHPSQGDNQHRGSITDGNSDHQASQQSAGRGMSVRDLLST